MTSHRIQGLFAASVLVAWATFVGVAVAGYGEWCNKTLPSGSCPASCNALWVCPLGAQCQVGQITLGTCTFAIDSCTDPPACPGNCEMDTGRCNCLGTGSDSCV